MATGLEILLFISIFWLVTMYLSSQFDLERFGIVVAPLFLLWDFGGLKKLYGYLSKKTKFWRNLTNGTSFISLWLILALPIALLINAIIAYFDNPALIVIPVPVRFLNLVVFVLAIPAILIVTFVHDFFKGIIASSESVEVEKSGIIISGAIFSFFTRLKPDQLSKMKKNPKIRLLSIGIIANLLIGLLFIPILNSSSTIVGPLYGESEGALIVGVEDGSPAGDANLLIGDVITEVSRLESDIIIETIAIDSAESLIIELRDIPPRERFLLTVNDVVISISGNTPPSDSDLFSGSYIGIAIRDFQKPTNGLFSTLFPYYLEIILIWIVNLNLMFGLYNLLFLPYSDGSRIIETILGRRKLPVLLGRLLYLLTSLLFVYNILLAF